MRKDLTGTVLALAAALALAAGPAAAQSEDERILRQDDRPSGGTSMPPPEEEREELSTTYSSIGLQKIAADFRNVEDAINLDVTLIGFRVPTVPWFGIELNLGFTMIPGEVTSTSGSGGGGGPFCGLPGFPPCPPDTISQSEGDFTATTLGAFAVVRSQGKFFGMGKLGYRYINSNIEQLNQERSGSGWGAGVGYRWNKKGSYAELGYTKYNELLDGIGFSISYSYDRRR
jgi:hypothetical protein